MASFRFKEAGRECNDKNCPFHGTLSIRGRVLEGVVASAKMDKTVIVRRDYLKYVPKFKRYERRRSRIPAHNPPCINAQEGDRVRIAECRPISKTVSFVVVEVIERGRRVGGEG
ncbi:30S ribosomal protein S17 [Candidatus Bathyarchaeota archaeon]|nr:MAG: 30S ribosomal protein S17 [Candidatus Bathyarchaeota archaeon]